MINNGAGFFDEREIVDAGFIELVRLATNLKAGSNLDTPQVVL